MVLDNDLIDVKGFGAMAQTGAYCQKHDTT